MKIIKALKLDKYDERARYTQHEGFVYKDASGGIDGAREKRTPPMPVYCVTLYAELEEGEEGEDAEYLVQDLMEKYYPMYCTDEWEEKEEEGKRICIFELESRHKEDIMAIAGLVGRRVYSYEDGNSIKLGIE